MTCGIYSITNKDTGKIYIGQSKNIEKRFQEHCQKSKKNSYIDRSINKYGPDAFQFEIIHECEEDKLLEEEWKFVNLYGAYENGYNLTRGGEDNPMNYSELRKKVSDALKGRKRPKQVIEKSSKSKSKSENKTGYYRVFKKYGSQYRLGYMYTYSYSKDNQQHSFADLSLINLEKKVREKGLEWIIWDEKLAKKYLDENLEDLKNIRAPISLNTTGFYRVSKSKRKNKIGYAFCYQDYRNNRSLESISIQELELKVISNGLVWEITNEKLAKQTLEDNLNDLIESSLKPHGNEGRRWSDEDLIKFSKMNNTTGYYKVHKSKNKKLKIGYSFTYTHLENGKKKNLSSSDIIQLEKKVKEHGFPWIIIDEETALKTLSDNQKDIKNKIPHPLYKNNFTGYFGVVVQKCSSCKKGFTYRYNYFNGNNRTSFSSRSLNELKKKVLDNGLCWKKLREENTIDLLTDEEIRDILYSRKRVEQ